MADRNLAEILIERDRTAPKRIVVVGDAMMDEYVHGEMRDCQDGCRKFVQQEVVRVSGGAAGAARCLANWCSEVRIFSQALRDDRLPVKRRFIVDDEIVFRHDAEEQASRMTADDVAAVVKWRPDAVLISDYAKGFLTDNVIRRVVEWCVGRGVPVVADPKRGHGVFAGAVLKCNGDYSFNDSTGILDHAPACVVTHGAETPNVFSEGGMLEDYGRPLPRVELVNHVGAGDCFAAHLTLALAHGIGLHDAAKIAYSAGRVYVQHRNGRPPHPEEIAADMEGVR